MIRFLQTPGRTKKIILGGILMVICGAMVITLIPGGVLGDSMSAERGVLAKVGNEEVTLPEVQQMARRIGQQRFGQRSLPSALMPFLMQQATESLIMRKAMIAEAQRMGLRVTDAELRDELQHGPYAQALFPGGQFVGDQQYESLIQQNAQTTVQQFEEQVKQDILLRKLQAAVQGGAVVTDADLEQDFKAKNTKVKFEYAVLSQEDLAKNIKPAESELKAFYEARKQMYANSIPEKRQAKLIVIDANKLMDRVKVTPDELRRYYNDHQDEFRVPEQVNLRQILIRIPLPGPDGKVDPKEIEAARQKAQDVLKQLKAGGNFAELAKKYSDDTTSKNNGGSLGWIERGRIPVAEVEQAAFSLPKGGTSDVIQSSIGFHIVHVDDKQTAHLRPLEEVRPRIEPIVARQKAIELADSLARKVETQARISSMEKAAADNGLTVETTPPLARTDALPGIGLQPDVMNALFAGPKAPTAPESVRMPQGYVVVQATKVEPAATPTFDQIRSRVEQEFRSERAQQMLAQRTQELADRARAEHNLKAAAKALGATVKTSDLVSPDGQVPDLGAMSGVAAVAFTLQPGQISGPLNLGNRGAVLMVTDRQEPPPSEFASKKDQVREQLLAQRRGDMVRIFADSLRQRMEKEGKIKVNKKELERLTTARPEAGL